KLETSKQQPATNQRKLSFKEKTEFEQLEKDMAKLEAEKTTIAEQMSKGNLGFEELKKLSDRLPIINSQLEVKELRWLELSE
ncbi:MAG: ABC transporter ATP-binding protein, partial [Methylotenera sp.]|nr:ABC transporter ATP-binding protein [Flavobacterium sp.]